METEMGWLGGLAILVGVICFATLALKMRLRHIAETRAPQTLETTKRYFFERGASSDVVEAVVRALQEAAEKPGFPVAPSDKLATLYGLVGEDLDDVVLGLAEKLGYRLPPSEELKQAPSVQTAEQLVDYFIWLSRLQSPR